MALWELKEDLFKRDKIIRAVGIDGNVEFINDEKIIIEKISLITKLSQGKKTIYLKDISAVQLKNVQIGTGYIQISYYGGKNGKSWALDMEAEENQVKFTSKQEGEFIYLKNKIEEILAKEKNSKKEESSNSFGYLNEIEQLAALKDKGIITEEEFQKKKKQILGI